MSLVNQFVTYLLYFVAFTALQVLLFLHLTLLDGWALCFVYLTFILMLPYQVPPIALITLGFLSGFTIDMFYNTNGIHAAATVLVAFLRPYIINFLTPRGGYDEGVHISIKTLGLGWFISYSAIIILIHHATLFFIWSLGYDIFLITVGKILASSFFTLGIVLLVQFLIQSPKKN
jgi:hypothetical protein